MRIGDLLRLAIAELEAAGVYEAAPDATLLLGHCLGMSRTQLYLAAEEQVAEASERQFLELLKRRKLREPVAYILGEREFWSLPFQVTGDVLIPRPETEFLLETVVKAIREQGLHDGFILDLCCGSGVIAIVLALELRRRVIAADLSMAALRVARANARRHEVEDLIDFVQADLLTPFVQGNRFAMVVSNPPYVSTIEMQRELEPEVVRYEPGLALHGGEGGLEVIRRIRRDLPRVLCDDGVFFMEIGAGQGKAVREIFADCNDQEGFFAPVRILPDYAGRDRVVCAGWKSKRG
jgi:release factor glutamine methyltransferase